MVLRVKVPPDFIAGHADEGYGKLADVFRRNMTSGQEVGAACAVYRDGKKVVDLWGGYRNGSHQGAVAGGHDRHRVFDYERRVIAGGRSRRVAGSDLL